MPARVPYLNQEDLSDENKDLLKRPIWLTRALVNSPDTARAFHVLGGHIRYGMKLDMRLRELAILQVGWLARSPFEWSHQVKGFLSQPNTLCVGDAGRNHLMQR